jgi:hypothetical protein
MELGRKLSMEAGNIDVAGRSKMLLLLDIAMAWLPEAHNNKS